ncbi:MAG: D-tyrosyl-tRNA(Tyr) deacylase [Candidatus Cloacimonetes bacterium]|nr:D-tyrosyl-tRNA(Tyr) deacylase [Candidatus Cloacimonadota bacterium]
MKLVIQRVKQASVTVAGKLVAETGEGYLILIGISRYDSRTQLEWLARKTLDLRIFEDEAGKMNRSLPEIGGEILLVSQFTLYADCRKGRRPGFDQAAPPDLAEKLYLDFAELLQQGGIRVKTGIFGADMQVELVNDGPVTILLEKE